MPMNYKKKMKGKEKEMKDDKKKTGGKPAFFSKSADKTGKTAKLDTAKKFIFGKK